MVTMNQGVKEVRDVGSRFFHKMEAGVAAVYDWMSGPAMTERERMQHRLQETEPIRRGMDSPL